MPTDIAISARTSAGTLAGTEVLGIVQSGDKKITVDNLLAGQRPVVASSLGLLDGANKTMGVATLVGGTKVVTNTAVTANSRIQLTAQSLGTVTVPKALAVSARVAGTSFTILSADGTDTSVVAWQIVEPH